MARVLGIDYGDKKVGVALTDENARIAFPKGVLPNDRMLVTEIKNMISANDVAEIVIGESRNKDGGENEIMKKARRFGDELARDTSVTIHFEPEYYSSQEVRAHTGTFLVDAEAAAVILNSFLSKRHGTPQ
jgi:putative holliday junction resolvase